MLHVNHTFISKSEPARGGSNGWFRFDDTRLVGGLVVPFEALENWLRMMHAQSLAPFHMNAGRNFNHRTNRTTLNVAATQHANQGLCHAVDAHAGITSVMMRVVKTDRATKGGDRNCSFVMPMTAIEG